MANGMESDNLAELVADIVSAYVSNNSVPVGELPGLISQVHGALHQTRSGAAAPSEEPQKPAVPVRRSINPDHIVCLEDGKKFKSLKRHLRTDHDMTPQEYRAKWGLSPDYPMVAPNYAQARSDLAKKMGLGQARRSGGGAEAAAKPAGRRGGGGRGRGARTAA